MDIAEKVLLLRQDFDDVKAAGYNKGYADGVATGGDTTEAYNEGFADGIIHTTMPGLTELTLPEGITEIRPYFYAYSKTLTTVNFPEGLSAINGYAFSQTSNLRPPTFPDTVETLGDYGFSHIYNFGQYGDLVLPPNLKTIGNYTFAYRQLFGQDLIIPASVETIGERAFIRAFGDGTGKVTDTNTTKIYFKGTPQSIAADAFTDNYKCCTDIFCPWAEGEVANAPWGASVATIHYNYVEGAE